MEAATNKGMCTYSVYPYKLLQKKVCVPTQFTHTHGSCYKKRYVYLLSLPIPMEAATNKGMCTYSVYLYSWKQLQIKVGVFSVL